jgi:hypothetical protein
VPYVVGDQLQLVREQAFGSPVSAFPPGTPAVVRDILPGGLARSYRVMFLTAGGAANMTVELPETFLDAEFRSYTPSAPGAFLVHLTPAPEGDDTLVHEMAQAICQAVRPPPEPVPVRQAAMVPLPLHFASSTSMAAPLIADRVQAGVRTLPHDLLTENVVEGDRGEFVALGQVFRKGPFLLGEVLFRFNAEGQREWALVRSSISGETGPPTNYTLRIIRDGVGPVTEERPVLMLSTHQLEQQGWRRLPFERGTRLRRRVDGYPGRVDGIFTDGRVSVLTRNAVTDEANSHTIWFDDLDDLWERDLEDDTNAAYRAHFPPVQRTAWEWLDSDEV